MRPRCHKHHLQRHCPRLRHRLRFRHQSESPSMGSRCHRYQLKRHKHDRHRLRWRSGSGSVMPRERRRRSCLPALHYPAQRRSQHPHTTVLSGIASSASIARRCCPPALPGLPAGWVCLSFGSSPGGPPSGFPPGCLCQVPLGRLCRVVVLGRWFASLLLAFVVFVASGCFSLSRVLSGGRGSLCRRPLQGAAVVLLGGAGTFAASTRRWPRRSFSVPSLSGSLGASGRPRRTCA